MAAWGRQHLGFLRGFAPFTHGVPSHDTLNDVINALDADLFEECFAAWVVLAHFVWITPPGGFVSGADPGWLCRTSDT